MTPTIQDKMSTAELRFEMFKEATKLAEFTYREKAAMYYTDYQNGHTDIKPELATTEEIVTIAEKIFKFVYAA